MGVFRKIGKGIGTVGGGVIGGTVKVAGKAVGNKFEKTGEWMEEVGETVKSTSKSALDTAGQFVDGAISGTYGFIKKDEHYKQSGMEDLKDSTGRTIKGIGQSISYTVKNAGDSIGGLVSGDKERAVVGLKNVGKVVAVSTLAIGVLDVLDGADVVEAEELETRNDHLNGIEHPETGVPFVERTIEISNDSVVEGTFPVFDSSFNVVISEELYTATDNVHFSIANDTLYQAIMENPNVANDLGLSHSDLQTLSNGQTPDGYTWHHHEEPGVIQLVDEETHANTAHTGGRFIWGGGSENR